MPIFLGVVRGGLSVAWSRAMRARHLCVLGLALAACKKDPPPPPKPSSATASSSASAKPKLPVRLPTLRRGVIPQAEKAEAVCNDGSPAAFYVRRGLPGKDDHWIVFLEGGGSCTDLASCEARKKQSRAMTSQGQPPRRKLAGIFDGDVKKNADFAGFTQVYVPYCSSDEWMGDRGASQETAGLHFRGHRILEAVIETLERKRDNGPNLAEAKRLVLAGVEEGGLGVVHHIDAVAARLPEVEVVGVVDGLPTLAPLSPLEAAKRQKLWGAQVDASCAEKEGKPEACHDAREVLTKHVKRPVFVRVDLRDARAAGGRDVSDDGGEAPAGFTKRARTLLGGVSAGFGPATGRHVSLLGDAFFEEKATEDTLAAVLGRFVFGREGDKKAVAKP